MKKALKQQNKVAPAGAGGASAGDGSEHDARPPPRLPPLKLPDAGGLGTNGTATAAMTTLNQAKITNATFTLTPDGTGVATFEFRSLQPLAQTSVVPSSAPRVPYPPPSRSGSLSGGGGSSTRAHGNTASKAHRQIETVMKGLCSAVISFGCIVGITLVGNLVFSALEVDSEDAERSEYTAYMLNLRATYNMSVDDFEELIDRFGTPLNFEPDSDDRNWGVSNSHSALFSFTIVSTIGYGNFAPATDGGKIFLMVYALIGIPVVGTCVGRLAAQFLRMLEHWAVMHMDLVEQAFKHYDEDNSGFLSSVEFRHALEDLGIHLTTAQFEKLVAETDDEGTGMIELDEFKLTAARLKLPLGKAARARVRLWISVLTATTWVFVGSFAYVQFEDWRYLDSLYFCVVTLTTIGLGDFVPSSQTGVTFHYFYCVIGLGLIALLLTAVSEFMNALADETKSMIAASQHGETALARRNHDRNGTAISPRGLGASGSVQLSARSRELKKAGHVAVATVHTHDAQSHDGEAAAANLEAQGAPDAASHNGEAATTPKATAPAEGAVAKP